MKKLKLPSNKEDRIIVILGSIFFIVLGILAICMRHITPICSPMTYGFIKKIIEMGYWEITSIIAGISSIIMGIYGFISTTGEND